MLGACCSSMLYLLTNRDGCHIYGNCIAASEHLLIMQHCAATLSKHCSDHVVSFLLLLLLSYYNTASVFAAPFACPLLREVNIFTSDRLLLLLTRTTVTVSRDAAIQRRVTYTHCAMFPERPTGNIKYRIPTGLPAFTCCNDSFPGVVRRNRLTYSYTLRLSMY